MVWSSFTDIVDAVATLLADDAGLAVLTADKWNSALTVTKAFKLRQEVKVTDMPLVMITVPGQTTEYGTARTLYRTYRLRLYCGFQQTDRVAAQEEAIKFEEAIEQAFFSSTALDGLGAIVKPGDSASDEGFYHPVYFFVKEIHILVERTV